MSRCSTERDSDGVKVSSCSPDDSVEELEELEDEGVFSAFQTSSSES